MLGEFCRACGLSEKSSLDMSQPSLTANFVSRHYVAFIRKTLPDAINNEEAWILFNDEKVVKAEGDVDEMKKFAYVYFFERV